MTLIIDTLYHQRQLAHNCIDNIRVTNINRQLSSSSLLLGSLS